MLLNAVEIIYIMWQNSHVIHVCVLLDIFSRQNKLNSESVNSVFKQTSKETAVNILFGNIVKQWLTFEKKSVYLFHL